MESSKHPIRGRPVNEQARIERRQVILAGARECIIRSGFHAASMSEIAASAGVSTANIYQYFDSKDSLIVALIRLGIEADLALIRRVGLSGLHPDAVREVLAPYFLTEVGRSAAVLHCEFAAEAARNRLVAQMLAEAETAALSAMHNAISAAQGKGRVPAEVDASLAAEQFSFVFDGVSRQLVRPGADGRALLDATMLHFTTLLKLT
jgi:AcrR family transcriptional regulator